MGAQRPTGRRLFGLLRAVDINGTAENQAECHADCDSDGDVPAEHQRDRHPDSGSQRDSKSQPCQQALNGRLPPNASLL